MHQWVLVLAVLAAASLLHGTPAAAQPSSSDVFTQLYAAVKGKQQRVQLGAGSQEELIHGPLDIQQPLELRGTADKPAVISCSRNGSHAFVVRGTILELQHVVLTGCSKQAIVLQGPGAVLRATAVTFKDHASAETAQASPRGGISQSGFGLIIAATDAKVELTDVSITGNTGARFTRSGGVPLWRPFLHPSCRDTSVSGGAWGSSGSDDDATDSAQQEQQQQHRNKQQACGSPLLGSSLIDLEQSTLVLKGTQMQDNVADALITARGSSQHSLQLLQGTQLRGNRARWLVVADSWTSDPVGRKHMKAPQPSEAVKGVDMQAPYTTYELMGQLRQTPTDEGKRRRLQQQQQDNAGGDGSKQQDQQQQQQQQQQLLPDAVVGKAPQGQVPLQVLFRGVSISYNTVQSGLLWLRLVNTSMQDTDIFYNIGTGGRSTMTRQLRSLAVTAAHKAADSAAAAGGALRKASHLNNITDPAAFARQVAAAGPIVPPGPCDVGSLQRSLLIVHAPSAFDMNRCRISHNIHFSGAVMRVTDGLGPTSLRSSSFANNTATAVLRFEGRTWVLNTQTFFEGIQFLDVLFYTQFQGASKAAYNFAELQHAQQQASKDKVSYDAFWFMTNTSMVNNTVFHSLVMSKGSRTSWRSFLAQKANILQSGQPDAEAKAKKLPLINLSTSWWMQNCTMRGNRLMLPPGSTTAASTSNTGPFSSRGSPSRSTESHRHVSPGDADDSTQPAAGSNSSSSSVAADEVVPDVMAPYVNEWLQAVPYAAYSDVLSAVLDADENLLSNLSQGGTACYDALRLAVDEQQAQLTLQVMLRATAPAVLWASTTQAYMESTTIIDNEGFFHTLRMDNAYVTWRDVALTNNSAALSIFDLWFGDAWVDGARVVGNRVNSGSVWNFESFRGSFQQILLQGNKAGTANPNDLAGVVLEDPSCKKPRFGPVRRTGAAAAAAAAPGSAKGSSSSPSDASSSSSSGSSSSVTLSPIWRMSHFLGELHQASILNNTGSIALDISGMALAAPLTELLVADNMASGIRLLLPEPKYDNQSIELYDVFVLRNSLSPAAPLVGGLLIGGFTSGVGATMPVAIGRSVFVNNTPAQPIDTLTLQGGGVCLQGPSADSADDPTSQHGFLQKLSITMTQTTIEGNRAAEGGGLWTAWPMIIEECTFKKNHAVVSGGGIYAKGLQQDSLGAYGAVILNHTSITNNTASFGGGIACDGCRAIIAAEIDGNQAIRNVTIDNNAAWGLTPNLPSTNGDWVGQGGSSNGGSNGGSSSTGCGSSSAAAASASNSPLRKLRHAVLGAGGGIAANLAGNSYVVICSSGKGKSINDRGRSSLRDNLAWALGGAVYLNSTNIAPDCPFPQPGPDLTETCFPGGFWPTTCGFNTLDLNWQGSRAWAGGDLVAWAGDESGFNMACTLQGSICSKPDDSLRPSDGNRTGSSRGPGSSGGSGGGGGGRGGRGGKPKGSKKCKGWDCKRGADGAGSRNSSSGPETCVRSFDAQSPFICAAGAGLAGKNLMLADDSRKFQLPASFYVYNTTCIQESRNTTSAWQACAIAGDLPHTVPRVFSGDTVNLTVSLGTTQQRLHPHMNKDAVLGMVQLMQSPEGLFVIGDTRQKMQMGLAQFSNMALQPVSPPISNKDYEFRFLPAWGPGNDLLRQVQPVTVWVKLMRCTLGMHMTINRCVRCSANGTYSLNPFTNEAIGCQPCPNGGLCQNGLLAPRSGYYSYNPFVPQILPCPLKGACTGGRRVGKGFSPAALDELQQQTLSGTLSTSPPPDTAAAVRPRPERSWAQPEPDWEPSSGRRRRRLTQADSRGDAVVASEGSEAPPQGSRPRRSRAAAHSHDGTEAEGDQHHNHHQHPSGQHHQQQQQQGQDGQVLQQQQQQQQAEERVVSRRQALMGYNKVLAELWANDATDGLPLLRGVEFSSLLVAWHRLQCNPGYTGMFCGRCDLNYVDAPLLLNSSTADGLDGTGVHGQRYGLYMGSCVPCKSPAVIGLAVFALFLLLFAYNAFGMCMQLRNSGVRDPYVRFVRARQAQQQQQSVQQSIQLQPQASGQASLAATTSTTNLARDSSTSQGSRSQQPALSHSGSSNFVSIASQQPSPLGHCYSVHTAFSSQPSYGFAVPFAAVGPAAAPVMSPVQSSAYMPQGSVASPSNPYSQGLMRATTAPSHFLAHNYGSWGSPAMQTQGSGGGGGRLSPAQSMGSPFLQQSHLPPLPAATTPLQQQRQSAPGTLQQQQQQQLPTSPMMQQQQQQLATSPMMQQQQQQLQLQQSQQMAWLNSSPGQSRGVTPPTGGQGALLPRANTVPVNLQAQANGAAVGAWQGSRTPDPAAAGAGAGAGMAGGSFVFPHQQQPGRSDQQQQRDQQQRQPSPQDRWWATVNALSPARQQSLPPPLPPLPPMTSQQQQQLSSQLQSLPQPLPNIRHRRGSSALNSQASGNQASASTHSSSGRGQRSPGASGNSRQTNNNNTSSSSAGGGGGGGSSTGGQQQQQQNGGLRKGPAGLLVGLWKVLTSYLQVLATVRHVSLRALPEMSNQALAFADLSSFTSFVALDCLLPGPQELHAFIKLFARTIGLPVLLLIASFLMWATCWLFRHIAVRFHRRYGYRHTRWQPLQRIQRQAAVVPDPFIPYISPRMLITLVVLSYSLYPLVTAGLLYTVQCEYIPGPYAGESATIEYSRRHFDWLMQRASAANSSSAVEPSSNSDIQLCRPGQGPLESGLCWLTGRFWAMDYDVQCFQGHHRPVAIFGLVMLLLVGVLFPVVAGVQLWLNRAHLDEWEFAWKWSFLYAEYKPNTCFWEFIIMGRKLAFLAATILLPMALDTPEETTAQTQLLVCVLLAVTFLMLQSSLHPFKRSVLNMLERLGLTAVALSCTLLAASLVVEKGRQVLLALLALINVLVVLIFLYHITKQLWLWLGAPAKKAVVTSYRNFRTWCAQHRAAQLLPWLRSKCSSCRLSCCGRRKKPQEPAGGQPDSQQQPDGAQANGHAPAAQQQQQQQSRRKPPPQQPSQQQPQANGHQPQLQANGQQQQQPLANGHVPQLNGHHHLHMNGSLPSAQVQPPATQQQQIQMTQR